MTEVGELITPTGILVMDAAAMAGDRDTWLAARRWRRPRAHGVWTEGINIGSSDVPSILDLDGVGTPVHVYRNKLQGVKIPTTEIMQWGHIFEGAIAGEWTRRYRSVTDEIGLVARNDAPWHVSTIDRRVRECPTVPGLRDGCALEIKNVGYASGSRFGRDIPDRILGQVAHQRYVTGYDHVHVFANIGGNLGRPWIFGLTEADQRLQDYVIGEVEAFRDRAIIRGIEPDWTLSKAEKLIQLDNATHPVRVGEADVQEIGAVMEYAQVVADIAPLEKRKKALAAEMRRVAAGAEIVTFGGEKAYEYKPTRRTKVDLVALREKFPMVYDQVVTETESPTLYVDRAYKIKPNKEGQA